MDPRSDSALAALQRRLGHRFADRLPLKLARGLAAAVFFALACWVAWHGIG